MSSVLTFWNKWSRWWHKPGEWILICHPSYLPQQEEVQRGQRLNGTSSMLKRRTAIKNALRIWLAFFLFSFQIFQIVSVDTKWNLRWDRGQEASTKESKTIEIELRYFKKLQSPSWKENKKGFNWNFIRLTVEFASACGLSWSEDKPHVFMLRVSKTRNMNTWENPRMHREIQRLNLLVVRQKC